MNDDDLGGADRCRRTEWRYLDTPVCPTCGDRHPPGEVHRLGTLTIGTHTDQEANDG